MVIIDEAHFPIRIISLIRTESSTHQADPRSHPKVSLSEIVTDMKLRDKLPAPPKRGVHTEKSD